MASNIPTYAKKPLIRFLEYLVQSSRLLELSIRGICGAKAMPKVLKVLGAAPELFPSEDEALRKEQHGRLLEIAQDDAEFAESERQAGFPLLHAHALVGIWGAFEAAMEDLVVATLMNEPELLRSETFTKLRVPLTTFELLEKDERMRLLVAEVKRNSDTMNRNGLDGIERLLAHVGLAGDVEDKARKSLWEMQNVRNAIVHRGSIADRRLTTNCPWLLLKQGDTVNVTDEMLKGYDQAFQTYWFAIMRRLGFKYGEDVEPLLRRATPPKQDLPS